MTNAPVVMLIHGIRTAAWWQSRIASLIEKETGATVIPIKYGYFDVLRFWCPFGFCRSGPVEKLRQQIEGVANSYKDRPLIVFAHSYGTYALTRVIDQNPYFRFDRVILCGSVVPSSYDWRKVEDQIKGPEKRNAIINECGTRDIWPVLAQSVTWGYGATGTFGFGTFNVRDRFHDLAHSDFFTNEFAEKYWIPLVRGDAVSFSDQDERGEGTPRWFNLLRLPLKWMPLAVAAVAAVFAIPLISDALAQCETGQQSVGAKCVETAQFASREELKDRVKELSRQVNLTLDLKKSDLFPLMDSYVSAPSPEKWQEVKKIAIMLLGNIEKGLKEITVSRANFLKISDSEVYYLAQDAVFRVEPAFLDAIDGIRGHFKGRVTIVNEMQGAGDLPEAEKVADWKSRLEDLHRKLEAALADLGKLLTTA